MRRAPTPTTTAQVRRAFRRKHHRCFCRAASPLRAAHCPPAIIVRARKPVRAARLPLPCAPAAPSPSPAAGRSSADEGLDQGDDEHGEQDELGEEAAADESEGNVPRGDARHLLRRNAEARQPRADVHLGYLTELYTSPRFAGIPPGDRYAVLMHVTRHYLSHIVRNGGALPREPAPFLRKHRTGKLVLRDLVWSRDDE